MNIRTFISEMRWNTAGLPPLNGNVDVIDYAGASTIYAVDITLIYDPDRQQANNGAPFVPGPETEVLMVKSGVAPKRWGGVRGDIDMMYDPSRRVPVQYFNPIHAAALQALHKKAQVPAADLATITPCIGDCFESRRDGSTLHILPVIGVCLSDKPGITPDKPAITNGRWRPLGDIRRQPNISPIYATHILPRGLGALGLRLEAYRAITGIVPAE